MADLMMTSNTIRMEQPFKILIDIWGVITSWDFRNDLKNYLQQNMSNFLEQNWNNNQLKDFISRLKEKTVEDRQTNPDLPAIVDLSENNLKDVVKSVIDNINWRRDNKTNTFHKDIQELEQSIWDDGYRNKRLLVHVFDDVKPAFEKWTGEELTIKIYSFASGSNYLQKLFLSSTSAGNLSQYVISGFNSRHRYKYDPKRFKQIVSSLMERHAKSILYLTDNPKKARAAIASGLRAVVVVRPANTRYSEEEMRDLQVIHTLDQLDFIVAM